MEAKNLITVLNKYGLDFQEVDETGWLVGDIPCLLKDSLIYTQGERGMLDMIAEYGIYHFILQKIQPAPLNFYFTGYIDTLLRNIDILETLE